MWPSFAVAIAVSLLALPVPDSLADGPDAFRLYWNAHANHPPVREDFALDCPPSGQCSIRLGLSVSGLPFDGRGDEVGVFSGKISRSELPVNPSELLASLREIGRADQLPADSLRYAWKLEADGQTPLVASWKDGAEKEGTAPAISVLSRIRVALIAIARRSPVQTASLKCSGSRSGPRIEINCALKGNGLEKLNISPIDPRLIQIHSVTRKSGAGVDDRKVLLSGKIDFRFTARLRANEAQAGPFTLSLALPEATEAGTIIAYSNEVSLP